MGDKDHASFDSLDAVGPITGYSRSCVSTHLYLENYKLLLDAGPLTCYTPSSSNATTILVTHLHHDHWTGLISLLGLKKCRDCFDPVHVYAPRGSIWFLKSMLMELERRRVLSIMLTPDPDSQQIIKNRIPVVLHELEGNQHTEASDRLMMDTFSSSHHCEGVGFKLSIRGESSKAWTRLLTYTGDTSIAAVDEDALSSPVLITECTYLESDKTQKALERGHMSLDNIVDIESGFKGQKLLLMHFKDSYKKKEIHEAIESREFMRVKPKAICTEISDARTGT
ncbi:MAG: MBL fold metallo-hydrolase [Promethearchaeati archaeon SRVP18_Atabeyarchaeia-1]